MNANYDYNINFLSDFSNKDTGVQKNKKLNINLPIISNISEFRLPKIISENNKKMLVTGDRFIPYKNNYDNNIQNFILNSSPFNNNISNSNIVHSLSLEEKPEKNYVNFIIDNMLKNSSDDYIIKNNYKFRKNKILTFSKNIYNTESKINFRKTINNNKDLNINSKFLNLSPKQKKNLIECELITELDNNDLFNNINSFIGHDKKGIITKENNFFKFDNKYIKVNRKIQSTPIRVLDAPNLIDDFYLNILEWGKENIIAVALSDEIYLWNENKCQTSFLMEYENKKININNFSNSDNLNNISSLSFMNNGICLGVGLPDGTIQLWDINKKLKIREFEAHEDRISCLSWNEYILSSGSKDKAIKNFDIRNKHPEISEIKKHSQEICSLKYSFEGDLLASGGNDNMAYIWDIRNLNNNIYYFAINENSKLKPYAINNFHQAAVKAMSWCPWKRHVLATGGGTKDRSIKIYSCDINKLLKNIDTGSQVCALLWNQKEKEIISSHGYNKNLIIIWNYEKNKKISELKGHMNRVLYLALSPDERYICSGSGDETLRFWKINEESKNHNENKEKNSMLDKVIVH